MNIDYREATLQAFKRLTDLRTDTLPFSAIVTNVQQEYGLPVVPGKSREYLAIAKALTQLKKQGVLESPLRGHWKLSRQGVLLCRTGSVSQEPEKVTSQDTDYLLQLTIQSVSCFGWAKKTHPSCATCRIFSACQSEGLASLQKMADKLD